MKVPRIHGAGALGLLARPGPSAAVDRPGRSASGGAIWRDVALLTLFATLLPFVVMNVYQPLVPPTRAALIYLMEPLVAAAYAYAAQDRALGLLEVAGAALIIIANGLQRAAEHAPPDPGAPRELTIEIA